MNKNLGTCLIVTIIVVLLINIGFAENKHNIHQNEIINSLKQKYSDIEESDIYLEKIENADIQQIFNNLNLYKIKRILSIKQGN